MALPRSVLLVVLVCQLVCGVFSQEAENEVERGMNMLYKTYQNCDASGELVSCLKLKAIKFADRALRINSIPLFEGVTIVRNEDTNGRAFAMTELDENTLPEDPETKEEALDDLLLDRVTRFFGSHSLQFSIPKILDSQRGDTEEGRGKYKKYMGPLVIAALMKGGLFAYAMKAVGILAAKALIVSKVALVLASVIGIKKLFGSGGGAESKTIEIVSKPQVSHSHAYSGDFGGLGQGWESTGSSGGSGGYSRRSIDTTVPYPEAQDLAFRGRVRH